MPEKTTKQEERERYFVRAIRVVGGLISTVGLWLLALMLSTLADGMPEDLSSFLVVEAPLLLAGTFLVALGISLRNLHRWAFYVVTVTCASGIIHGIVSLIMAGPIGITSEVMRTTAWNMIWLVLILHYVGNSVSRRLFLSRSVPPTTADQRALGSGPRWAHRVSPLRGLRQRAER